MNWKPALAAMLALALLAGCTGSDGIGVGGKKREKTYATIISLSPSTTDILLAAGGGVFLGGRTSACDMPMVAQTPIVVANTTPDYEKILSLEPDLIIYDGTLYGPDEITKIEELGIETLKYEPTTIDDYKEFGYRLASKIGLETPVANQLDRVDHEVSAARANSTTSPKATILLGPEEGGYLVMGVEGFHANILKTCGAEPIGAAGRLFQVAKIESLIDWNPEVIYSDGHAQEIYADPRLQQLAAVKDQRVFDYHPKELVRIGGKLEQMLRQFSRDMAEMPINPRERSGQ